MNILETLEHFFNWIEDGNAHQNKNGVWLEQTTQYSKAFTYEELYMFFCIEYIDC